MPGPRTWSNQTFPEGKADYPVTDVTWYEADAYAAFRGKRLPTIFQWEKAARNGFVPAAGVSAMPWGVFYPGDPLEGRANFGTAALPTTSAEFGMSAFGAYNMAGNVAEWTANDSSDGLSRDRRRVGRSDLHVRAVRRATRLLQLPKSWAFAARAPPPKAPAIRAVCASSSTRKCRSTPRPPPQVFATLAAAYRYEKTPLDARIEQTTETPEWKREKITFNGANGARAIAYLYLPNNVAATAPGHPLSAGRRCRRRVSIAARLDGRSHGAVRQGRACRVWGRAGGVYRAAQARRLRPRRRTTVEFTEIIVSRVTDLRRGLDYLETRPDIDMTRVAAYAPSAGSVLGMVLGAVEPRYRAFVFIGAGLPASYRHISAAANPINFRATSARPN